MDDLNPLDPLLQDGVIDEIVGRLKSGKEADLWLVRRKGETIAAKVYKDRDRRSFKNNAEYKEGREVRNSRTRRAIDSGSKFGREAEEQEWKSAEADALTLLHASGVRVPTPVLFYEGVLLMQLVLDADGEPALRLIDVPDLGRTALALYKDLRQQIVRMLCCDIIHGDLSAYNILAGAAGPTIIDFPQIVAASANSRAEWFFQRDFDNVLTFLAGFDRGLMQFRDDGRKIWNAYTRRHLDPGFVPSPGALPGATPSQRSGPSQGPRTDGQGHGQRQGQGQGQAHRGPQRPLPPRPSWDKGPRPLPNANPRPNPNPSSHRGPAQPRGPQQPPRGPNPNPNPNQRGPHQPRGPQQQHRGPQPPRHPQQSRDPQQQPPAQGQNPRGPRPPKPPKGPKLPSWLPRGGGGSRGGPPVAAHPDSKKPFRKRKRRF